MAFDADLILLSDKGKPQASIKVLEMDFGFTQNTDNTGKPTGRPLINDLNLVIESTDDYQIVEWMIHPIAKRKGRIDIHLQNNIIKTIKFTGYCVQYHESFNYQGDQTPMHISFTISVENISLDDDLIYLSNI